MKKLAVGLVVFGLLLGSGAAQAVTVSGSVTSVITYDDILDGPVTIEIVHPTTVSCISPTDDNWGEACEFDAQVRASTDSLLAEVFVFDQTEESIGSVRIGEDEYWTTQWQTAKVYISAPDELITTQSYTIGLSWFEDVTFSNVTPITVSWSPLNDLAAIGSKKMTIKNTKPFKNGSTIEVATTVKAPKNGCGSLVVKYKISNRAVPGLYNHVILVEDSRGNVAGSTILRTEDHGYRGTTRVVLCSEGWWYDEEQTVKRIGVRAGKYKIYLAEFDDYYISVGMSKKSNITFRN